MSHSVVCLLPVYNASRYLHDALASILQQSFRDFRLLIIDDGSTDNSVGIIQKFDDPRIILVKNEKNEGLISTLNKGIQMSDEKYLIRMDADDICETNRFEMLVNFMNQNPEYWVAGSQVKYFGNMENVSRLPADHMLIKNFLFFRNAVAHPSVILRLKKLKENDLLYERNFIHAEDYRLWTKIISSGGKIANLREPLLRYRVEGQNISLINFDKSYKVSGLIWKDYLNANGFVVNEDQLIFHGVLAGVNKFKAGMKEGLFSYLQKLREWILKEKPDERESRLKVFNDRLDKLFFHLCDESPDVIISYWRFRKRVRFTEMKYWLKKRRVKREK